MGRVFPVMDRDAHQWLDSCDAVISRPSCGPSLSNKSLDAIGRISLTSPRHPPRTLNLLEATGQILKDIHTAWWFTVRKRTQEDGDETEVEEKEIR